MPSYLTLTLNFSCIMIQRIQSLYLLLVVVSGVCLFFLPFASVNYSANITSFKLLKLMDIFIYEDTVVKTSTKLFLPAIINTVLLTLSLITLFIFKNRRMQLMLCKLMLLLFSLFTALVFYNAEMLTEPQGATTKIIYHAGTYMPVISLVLIYMAYKAILKDDELVKSADRIR